MNLDYLLILLNEIDNVNQPEKRSLENYLERLVENILKLQYWELEQGRNYEYWQTVVFNSRNFIRRLIKLNPSLKKHLEKVYPEIYQNAVRILNLEFYIPENAPIELEQILNKSYYG
jgi:Domain of unknown function DUF29